jgi:hypothetical protein
MLSHLFPHPSTYEEEGIRFYVVAVLTGVLVWIVVSGVSDKWDRFMFPDEE